MSYTEEEKQRILAEAHGQLERLRHFEPSERSNIIPLRRQREPEPPPPRMFNDSRIQSLIDAAIETTRAKLDEYREYVSGLLVELLERYVAEDISYGPDETARRPDRHARNEAKRGQLRGQRAARRVGLGAR